MSKNAKATAKNGMDEQATRAAVRTAAPFRPKGTLKLSNGIVLKIKPVSQQALRDAQMAIERPLVPQWFNSDRGDAGEWEPNEADPEYLAKMEEYAGAVFLATGKVAMVLGTEFISAPSGYFGPDDDEWLDLLNVAGVMPDVSSKARRYLVWVTYYALTKAEDQSVATMAPLLAASLSEEEIDRTVESFRDRKRRTADNEGGSAPEREDGDQPPTAVSGDRARNRRAKRGAVGGADVV